MSQETENEPITQQLREDVTNAGAVLLALPPGDELAGYQCTLIIRRADGSFDAAHSAVSTAQYKHDVGAAIRDRTAQSWPE
jgi:hypothetical protein